MAELIGDLHVRVSNEELKTLQLMGAVNNAPVSSVVRAMIRHFVLEWQAGRDVSIDLGAVVWKHRSD